MARPGGLDKRTAAYSDIFGRPTERRPNNSASPTAPSHSQLQMTAAVSPQQQYYDRRASMAPSQYAPAPPRPQSYYPSAPQPPPAQAYQGYQYHSFQPGAPLPNPPQPGADYHHPEPGPSRMLPPIPGSQPPPQQPHQPSYPSTGAWHHQPPLAAPVYNNGDYERSASLNSRATSFGSRTQSFGDRTQSFGDRSQSFGDRTQSFGERTQSFGGADGRAQSFASSRPGGSSPPAYGMMPTDGAYGGYAMGNRYSTADPPRLPNIDLGGGQYDFLGSDRRTGGQVSPPDAVEPAPGLQAIPERHDEHYDNFFGFDQYGAGAEQGFIGKSPLAELASSFELTCSCLQRMVRTSIGGARASRARTRSTAATSARALRRQANRRRACPARRAT